MQAEYAEAVEFLVVYVREAHALDGSSPKGGGGNPIVEEPITLEERAEVASACVRELDMAPMKVVLDDMKDTAGGAYAAWPDRLYLVDDEGLVAFAGERGPRGFSPDALEVAIRKELGLPAKKGEKSAGEPRQGD